MNQTTDSKRFSTAISRRNALKLAAVSCAALSSLATAQTALANEVSQDGASDDPIPNSWRFVDGQPNADVEATSDVMALSDVSPWTKDDDGQWCNSQGDPIKGALFRGIDVSEWQKTIDWDAVKKEGLVDFVIVRAAAFAGKTENREGKDLCWDANTAACERLGIPYGAYIYSYATSVKDAQDEADYILGLLAGRKIDYPVYLDLEDDSIVGSDQNAIARAFCQRIEAAGYQAGIYASLNWWNKHLTDASLGGWSRWVAQYNVTCDYAGHYDMWQATSKAAVAGIEGYVDINFDFVGLSSSYQDQKTWSRVYGQHDLDTMKLIAEQGWTSSDAVVIATRDTYWDALSASSLAGVYDCPILLTSTSGLSAQTKAAIQGFGAKTAYVVGGPIAIASVVDDQIKAAGCPNVVRVYGSDQQDTARKIAERVTAQHKSDTCIIATSWKFQDALSISPYAFVSKSPIFLCDSGSNALSDATLASIKAGGFAKAIIVGGPVAVDKNTESKLQAVGVTATRLYGQTEYETSRVIAEWELKNGMGVSRMAVATGATYYDALAGGALCGKNNSVLVIVSDSNRVCLSTVVSSQKGNVEKGYVLGGQIAVSDATWTALLRNYFY